MPSFCKKEQNCGIYKLFEYIYVSICLGSLLMMKKYFKNFVAVSNSTASGCQITHNNCFRKKNAQNSLFAMYVTRSCWDCKKNM